MKRRPWLPEPDEPRTRLALLRLFFDHSRYSLVAGAVMVLVQTVYAWNVAATAVVLAWALAFSVLLAVRAVWRRRLLALDDPALTLQLGAWQRRARWGSGITGGMWAVALFIDFDPGRPLSQMWCAMLMCLTCVASVNVMATQPRAFIALIVSPSLLLTGLFLWAGGGMGLLYAALVLSAAALAIGLMRRHAQLLEDSHALRYEREALLAQAEQARAAQLRFMAAASHDLRQPVHALGLLAAQAQAELQGRRAQATAAKLQTMAQALDELVGQLLDISKLDAGAVALQPQALSLSALFERLAPEFAALAEQKGLRWRLRPTALWVRSDRVQLERMLRNLLGNALRYTQRGGVMLSARRRGGAVEVAVWDTGSGIAAEHQSRIFDEFVQLQNPGRDRSSGHGLGLAIVARLARMLDHPVALRSRIGRGSSFSIRLPEAAAQARVSAPAMALSPLHGLAVALVEDDDAVREATATLLQTWGCRVWADATAAPLLQRLRESDDRPDCVISDWRLGHGNGMQAIEALRQAAGRRLPALLLSGETLALDVQQLQAQSITAARKPLPASALRAWLSSPHAA
jgi:signal transduction histidine kinase/CheY-like chemotaxis protein